VRRAPASGGAETGDSKAWPRHGGAGPQDPSLNRGLFRRDQSDSDGSFSLRDAAPGKYTVVAIEDGWELEWAAPR